MDDNMKEPNDLRKDLQKEVEKIRKISSSFSPSVLEGIRIANTVQSKLSMSAIQSLAKEAQIIREASEFKSVSQLKTAGVASVIKNSIQIPMQDSLLSLRENIEIFSEISRSISPSQFETIKLMSMTNCKIPISEFNSIRESFRTIIEAQNLNFSQLKEMEVLGFSAHKKWSSVHKSFLDLYNSIDFSKIEVDEVGSIRYQGEEIIIEDIIKDIDSYDVSQDFESEKEAQNREDLDESYKLLKVIVIICIMILSIQEWARISNGISNENNAQLHINESLEDIKIDDQQMLDNLMKDSVHLYQGIKETTYDAYVWATANPILVGLISSCIKCIYRKAKTKKECIVYSQEVQSDKNRKIKYIKKQMNSLMKKELKDEFDTKLFETKFRLVNKESLNVRTSCKVKAPIRYKLQHGEIVVVINKRRNWSQVQFEGKNSNVYIGWVLTRYLKRFN